MFGERECEDERDTGELVYATQNVRVVIERKRIVRHNTVCMIVSKWRDFSSIIGNTIVNENTKDFHDV